MPPSAAVVPALLATWRPAMVAVRLICTGGAWASDGYCETDLAQAGHGPAQQVARWRLRDVVVQLGLGQNLFDDAGCRRRRRRHHQAASEA
jgi:hypothetical protein